MDTTAEIIRILRELNEELANDNRSYDSRTKTQEQDATETKEKTND